MKKIFTLLVLALFLSGCGNKVTSISNPNDALIKIGSSSVTTGQVYTALLAQDPAAAVKLMATQIILNKEVEITEEMTATAQAQLEEFKTSVGESLDMYLGYYGYKDIDDYYTNGILPTLQQDVLVNAYLSTNYEAVVAANQPKKVRIMEVTDATLAEAALAEIKAGADFKTVAAEYSTASYPGDEEIVYNASELADVVLTWMNLQTTPTLSMVIPDTTNSTNYIMQITEADANKFKEEAIAYFALDTLFMEDALKEAFVRNGFKIYDRTVYDSFIISYADYIAD